MLTAKDDETCQEEMFNQIKFVRNSLDILHKFDQINQANSLEFSIQANSSANENITEFIKLWQDMDGNLNQFLDFEKVFLKFKSMQNPKFKSMQKSENSG